MRIKIPRSVPVKFVTSVTTMRFIIFLGLFVSVAWAATIKSTDDTNWATLDVVRYIISEGYHAKKYTVETEDGYILDLIRIPHYRDHDWKSKISGYSVGNENSEWADIQSEEDENNSILRDVSQYWRSHENVGEDRAQNQHKCNKHKLEAIMGTQLYEESENSKENGDDVKPAVLLMPGLMSGYETFVAGGPTQGLAFALADVGYDVFLGNVRGSHGGQKHTYLDPESDIAFWKFSIHEHGVKDLKAIIDEVLKISDQEKIYFVGHQTGATAYYILASKQPEYNDKIIKMISLSPVAFMGHSNNMYLEEVYNKLTEHSNIPESEIWESGRRIRLIGRSQFSPVSEIKSNMKEKCENRVHHNTKICQYTFFQLVGFNSDHYNQTTVDNLKPCTQKHSIVSAREILHLIQLMKSGRFQPYDPEFDSHRPSTETEYDLAQVSAPMYILYTPRDSLSASRDVELLIQELPNVVYSEKIREGVTNSMDLVIGKDADVNTNQVVVQLLKQREQRA